MSKEQDAKEEAKLIAKVSKETNFGKPNLLASNRPSEISPERLKEVEKGGFAADVALLHKMGIYQLGGQTSVVKNTEKAYAIMKEAEDEYIKACKQKIAQGIMRGGESR